MLVGIHTQRGFTLIEIMVALVSSVLVMLGIVGLYIATLKHSQYSLTLSKLDSEMHNVLSLMEGDIRTAGYWGSAGSSTSNPFMVTGATDLYVNAANNCVLLTYDRNDDGVVAPIAAGGDDEHYGYRLMNGAVQYRPWGAPFDCNAAADEWENLTDPNTTQVNTFSLDLASNTDNVDIDGASGSGTAGLQMRQLQVTYRAQLVGKPETERELIRMIRVHNDKYVP